MSIQRIVLAVLFLLAVLGSNSVAAGRVELNVFVEDERGPLLGQQEWLQQLAGAGVTNLRIHAKAADDKIGVEVRGTEASSVYVVTGMLTAGSELILPGGRFRSNQAAAVARLLKEIGDRGVAEPARKSAFGLSTEQFQQVRSDLARQVDFATQGQPRAEVARKIGRQLTPPLTLATETAAALEEDPVGEELQGLSLGTALAYALRPSGLCLVPRATSNGAIALVALSAKEAEEAWPVGWEPEKPLPQVLPALYEPFNANIEKVPLARVLDAIGPRLKVPVLPDHNALARYGVDLQKVLVNAPQSRTTYTQLLRKVLGQAKLKYELRVDDAGKPFLWVTTMKPL